jgi:dTDP-4-amino-4,6-dideoxygalactose transaminase
VEAIAKKHGLKVIYDAAHCFGTTYNGKSVFAYGDVSTASFHATKLFHTVEGGAVFATDAELVRKMSLLRNFGHTSPVTFESAGINAKNSEFHAAMGLAVLKYSDDLAARRKKQWLHYEQLLKGTAVQLLKITPGTSNYNYSYFPVVFRNEETLLRVLQAMNLQYVNPRRYFYPSLNRLDYVTNNSCPVSERIAPCVLCLPLFHDLSPEEQDMIVRVLINALN